MASILDSFSPFFHHLHFNWAAKSILLIERLGLVTLAFLNVAFNLMG